MVVVNSENSFYLTCQHKQYSNIYTRDQSKFIMILVKLYTQAIIVLFQYTKIEVHIVILIILI